MKISVCVRTLNEEGRIGEFCKAYSWADHILVADGGSEDATVKIAMTYGNVSVRPYHIRTELENGHWRNNDSDHANFLFDWAYELSSDWVIYDDCDMLPNYLLKENARLILDGTEEDIVLVSKLYLWGRDQHFPDMAKPADPHTKYQPSLWAWRGSMEVKTINVPPAYNFSVRGAQVADFASEYKTLKLYPPFCCLHFSWDNPGRVDEKVKRYRDSGLIPGQLHPLEFAGKLESLPEWARL